MPETANSGAVQNSVAPISLSRRLTDHFMTGLAVLTVIVVLLPLVAIFGYLVYKGVASVNWAFLTQVPRPPGESGGGVANGIVGSMIILGIASLIGVPVGIGAGIYLAEFGRDRLGDVIRFTADVLNGVPSIVIGIVAYGIVVFESEAFLRRWRAVVALAIMLIPTISRDDRRNAAIGAEVLLREARLRTGYSALAYDAFCYAARCDIGRDYGSDAGFCRVGARWRRCCSPPWGTRTEIRGWISPAALRLQYTITPSRCTTIGIVRPGPERSCLLFLSSARSRRFASPYAVVASERHNLWV